MVKLLNKVAQLKLSFKLHAKFTLIKLTGRVCRVLCLFVRLGPTFEDFGESRVKVDGLIALIAREKELVFLDPIHLLEVLGDQFYGSREEGGRRRRHIGSRCLNDVRFIPFRPFFAFRGHHSVMTGFWLAGHHEAQTLQIVQISLLGHLCFAGLGLLDHLGHLWARIAALLLGSFACGVDMLETVVLKSGLGLLRFVLPLRFAHFLLGRIIAVRWLWLVVLIGLVDRARQSGLGAIIGRVARFKVKLKWATAWPCYVLKRADMTEAFNQVF